MQDGLFITGLGAISAAGHNAESVAETYASCATRIRPRQTLGQPTAVAALSRETEQALTDFIQANPRYEDLDRSVKLALYAARQATLESRWQPTGDHFGICLGSSRGATGLLERYHADFLATGARRTASLTSPTTTLGNLSSWVAQDVQSHGPTTEISSTCSTSIYAVGTALAWLRAGMARRFLAGGAEAPLTDFTVAQMQALRIYSRDPTAAFPCRPCATDQGKRNSMVLGEGACLLTLERLESDELAARPTPPLARVNGAGFCVEPITTNTSLSLEGRALSHSMRQALADAGLDTVDLVVTHTPGTALGDQSELNALRDVFGDSLPILTSNKWILGHTLGASGALGIEYALYALRTQRYADYPYPVPFTNHPRPIRVVMVNAVGFGGNAGTVIVSSPSAR